MKYCACLLVLVLTGCYTSRRLERDLPSDSMDFPEHRLLTYSATNLTDTTDAYCWLSHQVRGWIFPRIDSVGPQRLQFYYDGVHSLSVSVSDSPNKHIRDFEFYVRKSGDHLIVRTKFNCIPFFPFLVLVQRQHMVLEMRNEGDLIFLSRNYFFLVSPVVNFEDENNRTIVLQPVRDSI